MKRRTVLNIAAVGLLGLILGLPLPGRTPAAPPQLPAAAGDAAVRLVVFNPEVFNIRALAELRKNGTFNVPNLAVIGVYHVKQAGDFESARKYVAEHGLDWFTFRPVAAEIGEADVFRKNACTPEFEDIVRNADGVIFFGGPDIPASVYGKKTNFLTSIEDPYRHYFELSAVFHLLGGSQDDAFKPLLEARPNFPILGICLGHQTLNVGTGGSLIQDIPSELYGKTFVEDSIAMGPEHWHSNPYRFLYPLDKLIGYNFHSLALDGNGLFVTAMGFKATDHPRILSSHHQAVEKLGKDLVVIATSRDGKIVEAVTHRKFPCVLGVQFHPEHPLLFDAAARVRQKPGDTPTSMRAILEGTPSSLAFNKAVWSWFAGKLVAAHGR